MKQKLIVLSALCTLILFTFAGCRNVNNTVSGAASDLNNAVSDVVSGGENLGKDVVSKVESSGRMLGGTVSGVVSDVQSQLTSK